MVEGIILVNRWLLAATLLFAGIEVAGVLFGASVGVTAVFVAVFTICFIGFFVLSYYSTILSIWTNPWIENVRYMEGPSCFNSFYLAWLFDNDRRSWAAYTTLWNTTVMTPIGGFIFHILLGYIFFDIGEASSGFFFGFIYLVLFAICQYQGYWKPRTREITPKLPSSVEAEWQDKNL